MKEFAIRSVFPAVLSMALVAVPTSAADVVASDDGAIVIRRTIPSPRAVDRAPLTSDRLSTTSTRLIDARRGHRPYSTVHRDGRVGFRHPVYVGYDDHFGISRAENRPFSYSQRTPRTGVTRFGNQADRSATTNATTPARPIIVVVRDERGRVDTDGRPDMTVRVHNDEVELPTRRGAVLITADGTVIQVGD